MLELKLPYNYNPFGSLKIFNANGIQLGVDKLFSRDKRELINRYFMETKKGPLAKIPKVDGVGGPAPPNSARLELGGGKLNP